jgi:lysophospholipase L1-like esterase
MYKRTTTEEKNSVVVDFFIGLWYIGLEEVSFVKKKLILILAILLALALVVGIVVYFAVLRPKRLEQQALQEAVLRYREEKNKLYREENEQYGDYEVDVAFLGDSLTDGYDVKRHYPQYLVCNRGIGGDTTFDLEGRLSVSAYELKPKVVVMLIGANNFDTMFENYERILLGLQENLPETKVVLLSLTSMSGEWGKNNELAAYNNVKIKKLAEKYGFSFVDLYSPLMDLETGQIYPEYTTDGGHLTEQGYAVLTEQITPVLESLLGK